MNYLIIAKISLSFAAEVGWDGGGGCWVILGCSCWRNGFIVLLRLRLMA